MRVSHTQIQSEDERPESRRTARAMNSGARWGTWVVRAGLAIAAVAAFPAMSSGNPGRPVQGLRASVEAWPAAASYEDFSFRLNGGRVLKCSVSRTVGALAGQARCDGFTDNGHAQDTQNGGLSGGNQAQLSAEERNCSALANRYHVGMAVGGLIVDIHGRGAISCVGSAEVGGRLLAVGRSITTGPFTCTGLATGLRCRASSGHGFFFGDSTWTTF